MVAAPRVPCGNLRPKQSWLCTQVSWCRLEVELGDLKCVMTKLEQPDPPPLTVAAISLKTVVNPNVRPF